MSKRNNYLYIGLTNDIKRRILEHNKGRNKSTKPYIPYQLIYSEEHPAYKEARIREKFLKSGCGRVYLKQIAGIV